MASKEHEKSRQCFRHKIPVLSNIFIILFIRSWCSQSITYLLNSQLIFNFSSSSDFTAIFKLMNTSYRNHVMCSYCQCSLFMCLNLSTKGHENFAFSAGKVQEFCPVCGNLYVSPFVFLSASSITEKL